jgi:hypothetical protein
MDFKLANSLHMPVEIALQSNEALLHAADEIQAELVTRGIALPNSVVSGALEHTVEAPDNAREPEGAWVSLSPEQAERAHAVISAMSEKFAVNEQDFSLVEAKAADGGKTITVMFAGNGIDLGDYTKEYDRKRCWNSIFARYNSRLFVVEVNGQQLDTRTGMTEAAYKALAADAKMRGIAPPDSEQMARENDDFWTWSWLTGEQADGSFARLADVHYTGPRMGWYPREHRYWHARFRPAVVIA